MTRDALMAWVAAYERAWRAPGLRALDDVFTDDAVYRMSPYGPEVRGRDALGRLWERERQGPDEVFTMSAAVVACDVDTGVVRVEVRYEEPVREEFRDLWVVRFAPDGRCVEFEEWWHTPSGAATGAAGPGRLATSRRRGATW
ncbi:MAG: YybH family protein [Carbonactinosporaceae bacterium]